MATVTIHSELKNILYNLYTDLIACKIKESLLPYRVFYPNLSIPEDLSDIEQLVLNIVCKTAAETLHLQSSREYWGPAEMAPRATQLHLLPENEINNIANNNTVAESAFSTFDRLSNVARFAKRGYSAKGLRDDMSLFKGNVSVVDPKTKKLCNILTKRNELWDEKQKEINYQRFLQKIESCKNAEKVTLNILSKCKSWGGPAVSPDSLNHILDSSILVS